MPRANNLCLDRGHTAGYIFATMRMKKRGEFTN
jgi:hypothetical protein